MIKRIHKLILIDKANMSKPLICSPESAARKMMKRAGNFRSFDEFIIIKNESEIIPLAKMMEGIGGDTMAIYNSIIKKLD